MKIFLNIQNRDVIKKWVIVGLVIVCSMTQTSFATEEEPIVVTASITAGDVEDPIDVVTFVNPYGNVTVRLTARLMHNMSLFNQTSADKNSITLPLSFFVHPIEVMIIVQPGSRKYRGVIDPETITNAAMYLILFGNDHFPPTLRLVSGGGEILDITLSRV